jgi:hypothetical protein
MISARRSIEGRDKAGHWKKSEHRVNGSTWWYWAPNSEVKA